MTEEESHALWIKYDRLGNRLQQIARKADLLAFAMDGLMSHHDDEEAWPMREAASEIRAALDKIAEEVRFAREQTDLTTQPEAEV
jgi:hypothetical protein